MVVVPFILALLVAPAVGTRRAARAAPAKALALSSKHVDHRGDCFAKVRRMGHSQALTQFGRGLQKNNMTIPGTGVGKMEPYNRVYKDGFMATDCVKDRMFYHGDMYGDHKHDYEIGEMANVSIVNYAANVPKEDQKEITPEVCFFFCRTLKNMKYFGIMNGRECYCEPYFEAMASDSSDCDAPCDGDASQLCGGKTKSSIYEMHSCGDAALVLAAAATTAHTTVENLEELIKKSTKHANGQQDLAVEFQKAFGKAGDPDASALMQSAKVAAGDMLKLAKAAKGAVKKLEGPIKEAADMVGIKFDAFDSAPPSDDRPDNIEEFMADFSDPKKSDFTKSETATKGDELVAALNELNGKGAEILKELQAFELAVEPEINMNWLVKSGPCKTDDKGCVMSNHNPNNYNNHEECTIEATTGEGEMKLKVEEFNTERWFDYLYVNGVGYHGADAEGTNGEKLSDVTTIDRDIRWVSDFSIRRSGWKLCGTRTIKKEKGKTHGDQYYPVMYFADKDYVDMPMTCTGTVVGKPIYFKDYHLCAEACDNAVHDCVGFSYFPTKPDKPNLCFLFSDFKSGQYYTGCPKAKKSALIERQNQTKLDQPLAGEPKHPVCVAKLSRFVGTTLKPDPSGKCDQCMKKLTKAQRCWS